MISLIMYLNLLFYEMLLPMFGGGSSFLMPYSQNDFFCRMVFGVGMEKMIPMLAMIYSEFLMRMA